MNLNEDGYIPNKTRADGRCGVCGKPVPKNNFNAFYCNTLCCDKAYNHFHEKQNKREETSWDGIGSW